MCITGFSVCLFVCLCLNHEETAIRLQELFRGLVIANQTVVQFIEVEISITICRSTISVSHGGQFSSGFGSSCGMDCSEH